MFVAGKAKWSSASCAGATYVQVKSDVPGLKEIMSAVLSAKLSGMTIGFRGACDTNTNYFNALYVVIE